MFLGNELEKISSRFSYIDVTYEKIEVVLNIYHVILAYYYFEFQESLQRIFQKKAVYISDYNSALWITVDHPEFSLGISEKKYSPYVFAYAINKYHSESRDLLMKM